ncbi:MAG: NTP transferase domain-containing protein [Armatimonadota bacterium]|nr:NTP transferase domain-containing protein [Armatimonadota bacterium]
MRSVVLLAAGMGTRLGSMTEKLPKCLIPFNGKTLLEYTIEKLRRFNFDNIVVVAGYRHDQVRRIVPDILVNEDYATTQPPYSLRIGLERVPHGPVLVMDADIYFEDRVLEEILKMGDRSFIITSTAESKLEPGSRVNVKDGRVVQIGRYISPLFPWQIHSGITHISSADFDYYKYLANQDTFRTTEMHVLLNELCKKRLILAINMEKTRVERKTGDIFLDGGSFSDVLVTEQDNIIRKESAKDTERLINEIYYLRDLPEELRPHFTELLDYNVEGPVVWYTMPHYPQPSLKKLILSGQFTALDAVEVLTRIVKFLVEKVYVLRRIDAPASYTASVHFNRVDVRREMALKQAPILKQVFGAKKFIINGLEYENPFDIIEKIRSRVKLVSTLQPPYLCMIHGDPHFDNLLIDTSQTPCGFRLVDPKGFCAGDPMYDISKLFHDFQGLYDFIYEYMFDLNWQVQGDVFEAEFQIHNCAALREFQKINEYFPTIVSQFFESDPNWYLRMKFIEAIHFNCLQPFHIKGDGIESKAIAMFLVGVQQMNNFWEMVPPDLKKEDLKYKLVNINTIEDFTYARSLFKSDLNKAQAKAA